MNKDFTIYKADEDKRLVFGWASVAITVDGETLEDRQNDMIDPEDLEEAAYEYVLNFRDAGEEHLPGYRKKGKLVESCVFTPEKQKAMGIPAGTLPVAWWIGFKIDDEETWRRIKDGTYKMFSIEGKANREPVEKTASLAQSFTDVLKFNPFHDALGKFSSAQGMRTYSANPKTKARSAGDHGHVMNVHRESKGENIRQNFQWITSGNKPWQNAAQSTQTATAKPKTTTKPNNQTQSKQPQNDAQDSSQSTNHKVVQGQDITNTIKGAKVDVNEVAAMQGFDGKPKVVSQKEFDAAVKTSGMVAYRTIESGTDVVTGKKMTSQQFADKLMYGEPDEFSHGGNGGKVYGGGTYIAATKVTPGRTPTQSAQRNARQDSEGYGGPNSTVVKMTLSPTAKVGNYYDVLNEFNKEPKTVRNQYVKAGGYGNDVGAYAAAKGYDALSWTAGNYGYTMVYNRTAMIICDKTEANSWYH